MPPKNYGRGDPMPTRNTTSGARSAFPPNVEPRGQERFGPAPKGETKAQPNIYNTDRYGTKTPWKDSK